MRYSEFIGKPRFETGVQGICYDFNDGVRIWLPKGNFHIKCTDLDTFTIHYEKNVEVLDGDGYVLYCDGSHYTHWLVEIQKDGCFLCRFECNLKGKNVVMSFLTQQNNGEGELGNAICEIAVIERFRRKHQCNIFAIVHPKYLEIFRRAYPDIIFISAKFTECKNAYQQLPQNVYAFYNIEMDVWVEIIIQGECLPKYFVPVDFRIEGCLRYVEGKLGLFECYLDKPDNRFLQSYNNEKKIREPYVCISGRGSDIKKEWNNPNGWVETVRYLKKMGYRALCIDGDGIEKGSPLDKALAEGLEDFTGYKPLQERVDLLYYADFFIGLGSGLSWLAWGTGKPVILISGFSLPFTEFYTPYRVINYRVCHGCHNRFARRLYSEMEGDLLLCKGTEHYLECSRKIDARVVCRNIDKLMEDYHLLPPKDRVKQ